MSDDVPGWLAAARAQWKNRGQARPSFAVAPGPGQESVWDYPRPPAIAPDTRRIEVASPRGPVARAERSVRVLETSHPPTFYVPPESLVEGALEVVPGSSHCEWKGRAEYLALAGTSEAVGWRYPKPYEGFAPYAGWVCFYPARVECFVAGERVRPQAGGFYGGWITDDVVGPFKGEPGTGGW